MTKIEVKVRPNARVFAIGREPDGRYSVDLEEPAEKGKANLELIKEFSRRLGCQVRLVRGATGRKKLLEVDLDARDIEARLAPQE